MASFAASVVDYDATAVIFDNTGRIVDAVFYNKLSGLDGAVSHSGDKRNGEADGDDEAITIDINAINAKQNISAIVVLVSVFNDNVNVKSCPPATASIRINGQLNNSCRVQPASLKSSYVFGMIYKNFENNNWYFKKVGASTSGRHFMACAAAMREVVDQVLDPDMIAERVLSKEKHLSFTFEKGHAVELSCSREDGMMAASQAEFRSVLTSGATAEDILLHTSTEDNLEPVIIEVGLAWDDPAAGSASASSSSSSSAATPTTPGRALIVADTPSPRSSNSFNKLCVGLGWTCELKDGKPIDLDASCMMLADIDGDGRLDVVHKVYFGNKNGPGVSLNKDNTDGAGEGDDETITVTLSEVPMNIEALAFTVTVFTGHRSFANVTDCFIRIYDFDTNLEVGRFNIIASELPQTKDPFTGVMQVPTALIFGELVRCQSKPANWSFVAIAETACARSAAGIRTMLWDSAPKI